MTPGDARQKAFVGLGFEDRSEAFDFQVALVSELFLWYCIVPFAALLKGMSGGAREGQS